MSDVGEHLFAEQPDLVQVVHVEELQVDGLRPAGSEFARRSTTSFGVPAVAYWRRFSRGWPVFCARLCSSASFLPQQTVVAAENLMLDGSRPARSQASLTSPYCLAMSPGGKNGMLYSVGEPRSEVRGALGARAADDHRRMWRLNRLWESRAVGHLVVLALERELSIRARSSKGP